MLILDEVDGAFESESKGAINYILNFIYTGEKAYVKAGQNNMFTPKKK